MAHGAGIALLFEFDNAFGFRAVSLGTLKGSEGPGHTLGTRLPHGDPQDPHRISLLRGLVCDQGGASGTRRPGRGPSNPGPTAAELRPLPPALAPPTAAAARRPGPGLRAHRPRGRCARR